MVVFCRYFGPHAKQTDQYMGENYQRVMMEKEEMTKKLLSYWEEVWHANF